MWEINQKGANFLNPPLANRDSQDLVLELEDTFDEMVDLQHHISGLQSFLLETIKFASLSMEFSLAL